MIDQNQKRVSSKINSIKKLKINSLVLLLILVYLSLYQCSNNIDPSYCCEGCSLCQIDTNFINNYLCLQCKSNFTLDQAKNNCVYNQCQNNLYFQNIQYTETNSDQCVALCSNTFLANKATNICEKQQECSIFYTTSNKLQFYSQILEAHQLNNNRILILYQGYYTLFYSGFLEKTVTLDSNVKSIKIINGSIFMYTENNNIYLWNEQTEEKSLILEINNIPYSQRNSFIKLRENYLCSMIVDQDRQQLQIIAIYNLFEKYILTTLNKFYQIDYKAQDFIINDIVIAFQDKQITVSRITYQNQNVFKEKICQIDENSQIKNSDIHDQNELILVVKVSANGVFLINKEIKQCKIFEKQEIQNSIQKIKTIIYENSNKSLIIIQDGFQFLVFDNEFNIVSILNMIISQNENILNWDIIQTNNLELIVLTSSNNVYLHQINFPNNQIKFEKINLEIQDIAQMIKIAPIQENQPQQHGVVISSQDSLILLKKNFENHKIEQKIFKNYDMPFPQQLGKIIKILIIEEHSFLVQCTENGFIQMFDISSGYEAKLIKTIGYDSEKCIDIQSILNEKIIAVLSKKIVIINLFLYEEILQLDITDNQTSIPSVSINGNYSSLNYNSCIMIYENSSLKKKFENCELIFTENLQDIWLGRNLELYLFTESTIRIGQINLATQEFKVLNTYSTLQHLSINYHEVIYETNNLNRFELNIVEILLFDQSQTLRILDKNLFQTHEVTIPEIKNPNMIKRAINDSSFYVLLKNSVDGDYVSFTIIALIKSTTLEIKWKFKDYYNSPIIQSPIKLKRQDGIEYYFIRLYMNLNGYCQTQDLLVQLESGIYYSTGMGYTYTTPITYAISLFNLQTLSSITYVGTENGELTQYYHDYEKYYIIDVSQYFKNQDEEIIQIEKFLKLEKYFILTNSQLIIFNIYTDEKEEIIDLSLSNQLNAKITILDNQNMVVYSSQNLIFLRTYQNKYIFKDYIYKQQHQINGWYFEEKETVFYVYGKGLNSIDAKLKLKSQIISEQNLIDQCIFNRNEILCKQQANLVVVDKQSQQILKQAKIKGFDSQSFNMFFDTKYDLLYLVEDFIQIYTELGNYKTEIQLEFKKPKSIDFQDEYIIISSLTRKLNIKHFSSFQQKYNKDLIIKIKKENYFFKQKIQFYQYNLLQNKDIYTLGRINYEQIARCFIGFNIIKQMYIPQKKQMLFSCENPIYSQVFVFDITTNQMIGKITSTTTQNGVGIAVDFFYDYQMDQLIYLDNLGNLYVNYFFLNFENMSTIKFIEMVNKNEQTIGFRFDYISNQIHAYTKKTLYKTNYIQTTDVFLLSLTQNKKFFKSLDINASNSLSLQYLLIDAKNNMFKYQDYNIILQKSYNEEIIEIKYLNSIKLLIIAFSDHFKIYKNYLYQSSYDWNTYQKTEEFLFEKFLDDNLFITFDQQIIQYDFENLEILNFDKFDQKSKTTAYLNLSFVQNFAVGFQNGLVLIYNKINFEKISINNLQETPLLSNKSIQFILELENFTLLISNIQGSIIEYNIQSKTIVSYKLAELVNFEKQKMAQVSDIKYDKKYKRLLFFFIGYQGGYLWDTQSKKIQSYFSAGNTQRNKILLSNNYIIAYSAFQLNLYSLSGESKYIEQIYGNCFYDYIKDLRIIEDEIIIIDFTFQLEIFYIVNQKPVLVELKQYKYPFILEYYYDKILKQINLVFLSASGISQEMVNVIYFINQDIVSCSKQIQSQEAQQIQMQIEMIQQKQYVKLFFGFKQLVLSEYSEIYLNVNIKSYHISFLNSILQRSKEKLSIMLQSIDEVDNKYILQQSSFTQLQLKSYLLKNFEFQVNSLQYQNQIIDINFNNLTSLITWQNITFIKNQKIQGIRINFINLTEVTLFNVTLSDQSLVSVIQNDKNCLFQFENVKRVYIYEFDFENNNYTNIQDNYSIFCFKQVQEIIIQNVHVSNNQNIFNFMRFDLSDKIIIKDFKIKSNNCSKEKGENCILFINKGCQEIVVQGIEFSFNNQIILLQTINIYELNKMTITYSEDSIKIIDSIINQNECNFQYIMNISQSIIIFENLIFTYNLGNIKINNPKDITINNSRFLNNQGLNGGAISIYNLKTQFKITKTKIENNKALGSGGGLYLENIYTKDIVFDLKSNIQNNTALIGGGIRIVNKIIEQVIPFEYPFKNIVKENTAELYGDNTCNFLQNIIIENNYNENSSRNGTFNNLTNYTFEYQIFGINQQIEGQTEILGQTKINSFKSGGNIYLNIFFIDEYNKRLKFSKNMVLENKYPADIIDELKSLSVAFVQENINENTIILTGETILNYNLYNQGCNCFQIKELSISSIPSITKQLQIQFITYKYDNQLKKVQVSIEFRKCQIGEVIQSTSSTINICSFCSDGTYSLIEPALLQNDNQIENVCKKCPDSALKCLGNTIQLKNGFWRQNNSTDEILPCSTEINSCKPEDSMSKNQGCFQGYFGPLCEECDLEGNVWGKYYVGSFNGKQCNECGSALLQYAFIFFQCIGVILYLTFNSSKLFQSFSYLQTCYYLRQLQFLPMSQIQLSSRLSSFIKIIVSYFQFSSLLVSQVSVLPLELNIIPNFFGSSNKMMALSISCVIPKQYLKDYGKTFILCFLNTLIPLVLVLFSYFFIFVMKNELFPTPSQRKYIVFILIGVIYIFFLQGTISFFTTVLTCRQIGTLSYNPIDLNQLCNEGRNIIFIKVFSACFLLLLTIFPLILLQFLRKQKSQLDTCQNKFKFGYFYLELKYKFYYWEFVRILLKVLVVILYTLLKQDYQTIARQIVILMLSYYIYLVTQIKPFQSQEIMSMEILSLKVIIVKIFLQIFREQFDQALILFGLLTFTLDCSFLIYFILNITSLVGRFLKIIIKKLSNQLYNYITKSSQVQFITYKRWIKVKQNISIIVKQKATHNINLQSKLTQSQNNNIQTDTQNSGMNLINSKMVLNKQQSQSGMSLINSQTPKQGQSQLYFLLKNKQQKKIQNINSN